MENGFSGLYFTPPEKDTGCGIPELKNRDREPVIESFLLCLGKIVQEQRQQDRSEIVPAPGQSLCRPGPQKTQVQFEFTDEEMEGQRGQMSCPASHSVGFPTLRPGFFLSRILISSEIALGGPTVQGTFLLNITVLPFRYMTQYIHSCQ